MSNVAEVLNDIIADPINGPYEGEDYWIDDDGAIQVAENNIVLAANILRRVNNSELFDVKLVKIGQRGDSILLGFDTLLDSDPVYTVKIGFQGDTLAEVKRTQDNRFCVYLNKKRATRMFKKLVSAKTYLKQLDKDMRADSQVPEAIEE